MVNRLKWHTKGSTKHSDSLKTDRERAEATENQRKKAGAEAEIRFARIKSGVVGPIFNEVVARLVAEGFFGETVEEQNDASGPISLNVNYRKTKDSAGRAASRYGLIEINIHVNLESPRWLKHRRPLK